MNKGILGVTNFVISHKPDHLTEINLSLMAYPGYNPHHLLNENWKELFPDKAVVKCSYCGQWAAIKTVCKHCGATVE